MNVILDIPEDLQTHIQADVYANAVEYFLDLGQQDRQRQSNQEKIAQLLQESLDSDRESVTLEYWTNLHTSIVNCNN